MRYAIYFTPPEGSPLAHAGASWLGRDALSGSWDMMPEIPGLSTERQLALTESPRRYGFHATLKAPFALKPSLGENDVLAAADRFAASEPPAPLSNGLEITNLAGFLSLIQAGDDVGLNAIAAAGVRHFEPLRAPLTEADIARRRLQNLTPEQDELLLKWGYPYVFDEFGFHMTLSQRIDDRAEFDLFKAAAEQHFQTAIDGMTELTHVSVFKEKQPGDAFFNIQSFRLSGEKRAVVPKDPPVVAANQGVQSVHKA